MNNLQKPFRISSLRIHLKILLTVLLLGGLTLGMAYWAISSESFGPKLALYLIESAQGPSCKIESKGLTGSLLTGINCRHLTLRKAAPYFAAEVENLRLSFDFSRLPVSARVMAEVDCEKVTLSGSHFPADWLKKLPKFPEISCFASLPGNLFLDRAAINRIVLRPCNDDSLRILFDGTTIERPDAKGQQKLTFAVNGFLQERRFAVGSFSASLEQKKQKAAGRVELCFAGRKIVAELVAANKGGRPELSGHVIDGEIDLAVFSRWLIPLWQQGFPFGFDGLIKVGGSWLYNEKAGFLSNLSGEFSSVRLVAQGLFITIFELNGQWKLFDGSLELSDGGSLLAGFPAHLDGRIESIFNAQRRWMLNLKADTIDMARFYADLPWGVRYGSGIPALAGNSRFSMQIRGSLPEVDSSLKTDGIQIIGKTSEMITAGSVSFKYLENQQPDWQINLRQTIVSGNSPFFQRFVGNSGNLGGRVAPENELIWEARGKNLPNLVVKGALRGGDSEIARVAGSFHEGNGRLQAFWGAESEQKEYRAENLTLLQLLLAY